MVCIADCKANCAADCKALFQLLYERASSLGPNRQELESFSVTILASIIDVCVVWWRAPKEKHNNKAMIYILTDTHANKLAQPFQYGGLDGLSRAGVTTSRVTSGGSRKDRNTNGQRVNKFNTSYRDISVIVAENNSLLKPKCQQYTLLVLNFAGL